MIRYPFEVTIIVGFTRIAVSFTRSLLTLSFNLQFLGAWTTRGFVTYHDKILKTLFNIVEERFKKELLKMSVLYNDVHKGQ